MLLGGALGLGKKCNGFKSFHPCQLLVRISILPLCSLIQITYFNARFTGNRLALAIDIAQA